jgi:hypothetical protein
VLGVPTPDVPEAAEAKKLWQEQLDAVGKLSETFPEFQAWAKAEGKRFELGTWMIGK